MSEQKKKVRTKRHKGREVEVATDADVPITEDNPGGLEAAGYKRLDQLKRRKDELDKEIEELAASQGLEAADPSALKPDREVLQHFETDPDTGFDDIPIDNPDPSKVYFWCQCMFPTQAAAARFVIRAKRNGWKEVTVKDTYNGHRIMGNMGYTAQGTFIVGDTVLMQMDRERYERMVADKAIQRERLAGSADEAAKEFARKHGIIMHDDPNDPMLAQLYKRGEVDRRVREQFTDQVKEGRVPGMPASQ